ncbi:MAG: 3-dehydroquinate synthase [Lachnospiraceae bacterium]|nr:3-dehydroquinate synthase [Lachnospiraceae bacterium]
MKQEKMDRIPVHADGAWLYDIVLADSFAGLQGELERLSVSQRKLCIVTDSQVAPLYLAQVEKILAGCCRKACHFIFPAGEENKNLDTVRELYEYLIVNKYDRKDCLVALGGGVVGDLTGFAAATYLRGIDFIQLPTTLLSQVDSGIGGKTGVDFDAYKNMVGAFHMPKLVYTNVSALKTLPGEQFSAGMGEVLKHGLIRDKEYFAWLVENRDQILAGEQKALWLLIQGSDLIKREVVELDPTEQNERATLNFGHTLGHAIEKLKNFSMLHGHCVAVGALAAMEISRRRGMISKADVEDYRKALADYGIRSTVSGLSADEVLAATKNDKKMEAGVIKFVLLNGVGNACIDRTVTTEEMREGLFVVMNEDGKGV